VDSRAGFHPGPVSRLDEEVGDLCVHFGDRCPSQRMQEYSTHEPRTVNRSCYPTRDLHRPTG
jgi:hypothetical protein